MADVRHLHRDYHSAECGLDASHILMTYADAECTCSKCLKAKPRRLAAEEAERERQRREILARQAEEAAREAELQKRLDELAANRRALRRAFPAPIIKKGSAAS